jgi:hypothetical protein
MGLSIGVLFLACSIIAPVASAQQKLSRQRATDLIKKSDTFRTMQHRLQLCVGHSCFSQEADGGAFYRAIQTLGYITITSIRRGMFGGFEISIALTEKAKQENWK